MTDNPIVAVDIGGTKIKVGRFFQGSIVTSHTFDFNTQGSEAEILHFLVQCIKHVLTEEVVGIALGVPCIVDVNKGVVFDAVNIAAWQEVALKTQLEMHFKLPVYINNDVNCFAVGESDYGDAKHAKDMVGICLGTGFGAGIVINNKLHGGQNCSAGEIGSINYLEGTIDDYCSGSFFKREYNICGAELANKARQGDKQAQEAFQQFGYHLAQALSHVLFVLDPHIIVIGGSVAKSFDLFIDAVWQALQAFPYPHIIKRLAIVKSKSEDMALLGAAQLFLQAKPALLAVENDIA